MKKYFGLIGEHLLHSYSAMIHDELGQTEYQHTELKKDELEDFFRGVKIGGINITIPYKKDVFPFCDELSSEAREIGAVNTIYLDGDKVIGHNTDADGFLFMAENAGITLKDKKVLVLGSGGASLAVKYALKKAGARDTVTISRNGEDNYSNISRHFDADVIVNATPVGMFPESEKKPIELSLFKRLSGVLDLIYNPFKTNLLIEAEERKLPFSNGLSMLVSQAKLAEEKFRGEKIDDSEILRIMKKIASDKRNIALIGMPGSGKSTIGKELSKISGKPHLDLDTEIERLEGRTIPEIFEKGGESLFRKIESKVLFDASSKSGHIIVTGGGAVKTPENYLPLKRTCRIYHIEKDIKNLSRKGRPLSIDANLEEMYRERLPLYKKFRDAKIEVEKTADKTAERIWRDFLENSCD